MYSEVEKIIFIGSDITNEKMMEIESKKQNETLKNQEKLLRESEKILSRKLKEAKNEIREQYRESEKAKIRNEKTLEGALDAIITTSTENKVIFYNTSAEKLFGYSKDEVMGNQVAMLFDKKSIAKDDFLKKYTTPGDNKIVGKRKKVMIRQKDGKEQPVLVLLTKAEVENEITYTAFIQTNYVETA